MSRVFGRGELKAAVLAVLAEGGPANGYGIMQALAERVGSGWSPSPGSVYPALLALEEVGLVGGSTVDGGRTYALTPAGADAARRAGTVFERAAGKARSAPPRGPTLGSVLDALASSHPHRSTRLTDDQADQLERRLHAVLDEVTEHRAQRSNRG